MPGWRPITDGYVLRRSSLTEMTRVVAVRHEENSNYSIKEDRLYTHILDLIHSLLFSNLEARRLLREQFLISLRSHL